MAVKTPYEPKEARITFDEKYYCYDEKEMKGVPRKRTTGTQALVEFLNNTSPEEFHKQKRSSTTLFFKRRHEKKSTNNDRKSYIDIIPNPFTSFHNKSKSVSLIKTTKQQTIILPDHRKSTQTQTTTTHRRQIPSLRVTSLNTSIAQHEHVTTVFESDQQQQQQQEDDDDLIEGGLKKRLEKYPVNPSDVVAHELAKEHTVALELFSNMVMHEQHASDDNIKKKRGRHIQVQTMPTMDDPADEKDLWPVQNKLLVLSDPPPPSPPPPPHDVKEDQEDLKQRLAKAEKDLKQEKLLNARLQASLEDTRDQFEVLTGLAYKKLREVWEEKTRWENACNETKERCWQDHQQLIIPNHSTSTTTANSSILNKDDLL
ncbi:hypothetical protein BD770DRAFT_408251 [Pilaira anomala]|nr:hypothetical protein BD770DRAFT_408251 [Pilaira anomala]